VPDTAYNFIGTKLISTTLFYNAPFLKTNAECYSKLLTISVKAMTTAFRTILFLMVLCSSLWASTSPNPWYTQQENKDVTLNVELYVSSTCKYCHRADAFFSELETTAPWLHVTRYTINQDKQALIRFNQLLAEQNGYDFSVPSVFFCNSRWIGFSTNETTGKDLLRGLNYCKSEIEKSGTLTPVTVNVLKRWANANLFDSAMVENPSAVKYITTIALMDAYNPCSLFCITGFFALLFLLDNRKKQMITGLLFLVAVGTVHYFQQVHASAFFGLLPWLRLPAAGTGLFAFYLAGQYYRKRTATNLLFLLSFLLAFMIQAYQQTCVMNWSYIFEQWLYNQQLTLGQHILYQVAYQSMYLLSLLLVLILYILLIRIEFFARFKQKFLVTGVLYIMAIGLIMIVYPLALANLALSLFVIVSLFIAGWILDRYTKTSSE
jgi:glutaredoxin